jgi:hypothetical protein
MRAEMPWVRMSACQLGKNRRSMYPSLHQRTKIQTGCPCVIVTEAQRAATYPALLVGLTWRVNLVMKYEE